MNYFLIPGNPPAVQFYEIWAQEIKAINQNARVRVSSYPMPEHFSDSEKAMQFIFTEHLKQLISFRDEVKGTVTIIGHSLGGYFALKLLDEQSECIDHVVLVHPFLRKPSLQGQLILKAAASLYQTHRLQKGIVKNRKRLETFLRDLTFVTDEEILKSFHIAHHERLTIGQNEKKIEIHPSLQNKIVVFFTKNDTWCGNDSIGELKDLVKVIECHEPHGFVTQEKHRKSLFQKILVSR